MWEWRVLAVWLILKKLHLSNCHLITSEGLRKCVGRLHELKLAYCQWFFNGDFERTLYLSPSSELRTLEICKTDSQSLRPPDWTSISSLKKLERLKVNFNDWDLSVFKKSPIGIQVLRLEDVRSIITDKGLEIIGGYFKCLRELSLVASGITPAGAVLLPRSLRTLSLNFLDEGSPNFLEEGRANAILRKISQMELETLIIQMSLVTDVGVAYLATSKTLKFITFEYCGLITKSGVESLFALKQLETLSFEFCSNFSVSDEAVLNAKAEASSNVEIIIKKTKR